MCRIGAKRHRVHPKGGLDSLRSSEHQDIGRSPLPRRECRQRAAGGCEFQKSGYIGCNVFLSNIVSLDNGGLLFGHGKGRFLKEFFSLFKLNQYHQAEIFCRILIKCLGMGVLLV